MPYRDAPLHRPAATDEPGGVGSVVRTWCRGAVLDAALCTPQLECGQIGSSQEEESMTLTILPLPAPLFIGELAVG